MIKFRFLIKTIEAMKKISLTILLLFSVQTLLQSQVATYVVLAEVYGGGGEQGSHWTNDYILLFNPTESNVELSTWAVQYAMFHSSNWHSINLNGSIASGGYYFIQLGGGGAGRSPLPFTPNVVSNININKIKGKIALTNFQNAITVSNPVGQNGVIDFIGYGNGTNAYEGSGPAPQTSTTESIRRKDNNGNNTYGLFGNGWDSNDNLLDFRLEGNLIINGPLPVELSAFSAIVSVTGVSLKWRTETEVNNYGFEIQKSEYRSQELEWNVIGFVPGNGNSNSPKDYSFFDSDLFSGKYLYRLKQLDTDGNFEYSKTIEVDFRSELSYQLNQNFPNPFNPSTTITFSIPQSGNVKLTVYNLIGEKISEIINQIIEAGTHSIIFNASQLNSGIYIYKIETNNFIQSRKMTFIK